MGSFLINQKKKIMIILVMPLLKTELVDGEDLEVSEDLVEQISLISLKIFLVILVEADEVQEEEALIIGAQI